MIQKSYKHRVDPRWKEKSFFVEKFTLRFRFTDSFSLHFGLEYRSLNTIQSLLHFRLTDLKLKFGQYYLLTLFHCWCSLS